MRRIARIKRSIMPPAGRRGCGHRSRSDSNDSPTGFIHEDSGQSFVLDVADLVRDTVTIPCAFKAAAIAERRPAEPVERLTRRLTGERLRRDGVIPLLIERIKTILSAATSEEVAAPALRKRKEELDSHGADRTD